MRAASRRREWAEKKGGNREECWRYKRGRAYLRCLACSASLAVPHLAEVCVVDPFPLLVGPRVRKRGALPSPATKRLLQLSSVPCPIRLRLQLSQTGPVAVAIEPTDQRCTWPKKAWTGEPRPACCSPGGRCPAVPRLPCLPGLWPMLPSHASMLLPCSNSFPPSTMRFSSPNSFPRFPLYCNSPRVPAAGQVGAAESTASLTAEQTNGPGLTAPARKQPKPRPPSPNPNSASADSPWPRLALVSHRASKTVSRCITSFLHPHSRTLSRQRRLAACG